MTYAMFSYVSEHGPTLTMPTQEWLPDASADTGAITGSGLAVRFRFVSKVGFEPTRVASLAPQTSVSAISPLRLGSELVGRQLASLILRGRYRSGVPLVPSVLGNSSLPKKDSISIFRKQLLEVVKPDSETTVESPQRRP